MWGSIRSLLHRVTAMDVSRQVRKALGVSERHLVLLTVMSVTVGFSLSGTAAHAQDDVLQRFSDAARKYWNHSKALAKTDAFNIRVALRRAVRAEQPGTPFRWNNNHTKHYGEIVLLDFIQPRRNERMCADYKHTYFMGGTSPIEDKGMVCRDSDGRWDDVAIRATFEGTRRGEQSFAQPRYNREMVREVQDLLNQLNYDTGSVDGNYGPRTRRAIVQYQRNEGLPVTGQVSTELATALKRTAAIVKEKSSASIDDASDTDPAYASPSGDVPQPIDKASPNKEGAGDVSTKEGASEFASQRDAGDARPGTLFLDGGTAAPSGRDTLVTAESGDSLSIDVALADDQPVLLIIDGAGADPVGPSQSISKSTNVREKAYLRDALRQEWTFTDDWLHLPWSVSFSDITMNIVLVKNAVIRAYRTANQGGRQLVIAAHGWGGVLVYRAILELYKEKRLPAGAIDVLVTIGVPLSAQTDSTRYSAQKHAYWQGSQTLAEPVKVWLNYWIKEDQSSGSIIGVTKNTRLPYTPSADFPPNDAYYKNAVFQNRIERDILGSLQNSSASNFAQGAERSTTDEAISVQETAGVGVILPSPVDVGVKQKISIIKIDKQQTEFNRDYADNGSTKIAMVSKTTSTPTKTFQFPWLFAILGLAFCVLAGALFSWLLVPRVNDSSDRRTWGDRTMGTDEHTASIQSGGDTDQAVVLMSDHTHVYSHQNEEAQTKPETREAAEIEIEPQTSTPLAAEDDGNMVLQGITKFDDIIKETERVLSRSDFDRDTRSRIVEAVEVAKSLIEKTFNKDPIAGADHGQTAEAIAEATKLIKDALETNPNPDTSRLRFQHKI